MVFALPFLLRTFGLEEGNLGLVVGMLVGIIAVVCGLQYPFLMNQQTLGKAFFGLRIESTNDQRPITPSVIVQRELFAKVMTCYFMCLPVLIGQVGKHDEACETEVV